MSIWGKEDIIQTLQQQKVFFVLAGNIGSGKTTLTGKLAKSLAIEPFYESVQDNPYLEDFYKDMARWSFPLQVYFLNHRYNTHRVIEAQSHSAVQDRSLYEDAHIFARVLHHQGHMSGRDFENYMSLYQTLSQWVSAPTLLIYLRRSVDKLVERIQLRSREYEKGIDVNYLARLNDYYEEWFENYRLGPAMVVETNELDFIHNPQDYQTLLQKIHYCLNSPPPSLTLASGTVSLRA